MKHLHRHLMLATALAAGMIIAAPLAIAQVRAEESATVPTNPGFKPDTGQINPGVTRQAPSNSADVRKIPTAAEARAAKMMPISTQPSAGAAPASGPQGNGAKASAPDATPAASGQQPAATTGAATSEKAGAEPAASISAGPGAPAIAAAAAEPPPSGPIGSVGETIPAKFSERNDILDRVPIMAWPLSLSDQQRQQIYQAVMADKSQPAADADALAPTSELSTNQALNEMRELPASVSDIAAAKGLKYVKAKDKVLLVTPSTRTVVEQITL
jgi:hypothetical protein